jgi:5-methylthioribose kinase
MNRLTAATLEAYLRGRGVVRDPAPCAVLELTGGVSNDVFGVVQPAGVTSNPVLDVVVKQSLPELKVAQTWIAPVERILTEGKALRAIRSITPEHVPEVLDVDGSAMTVTMARAPSALHNLRDQLISGTVEPETASTLGSCLGQWHGRTADDAKVRESFPDTYVESLRIEPYYRRTADVHEDLADVILAYARQLTTDRHCLVHGDFTPKNVLSRGSAAWVLDWEVSHFGNPVFDLASLPAHLLLKAVHRPRRERQYHEFVDTFLEAYERERGRLDEAARRSLTGHIGCLLLARVDGKSPADYLTAPERERVRALGRHVLTEQVPHPQMIWEALRGA